MEVNDQRSLYKKPDTFEELALKLINCFPKGANEVHFVGDSYLNNNIKAAKRKTRGKNQAVIIKSMKSKIPADLQTFVKNDDNKTRIIDLLLDYIIKHKNKVLNILRCMKIYFFKYNRRQSTSLFSVDNLLCLSCDQQEVETRIFRHCQDILNIQKDAHIAVRSPSDDTDIIFGVSCFH